MFLLVLIASALSFALAELGPTCSKPIYCNSTLLHKVQLAGLFNDSKTFVDLKLNQDTDVILTAFQTLLNKSNNEPTKLQIAEFVDQYFSSVDELDEWTPADYCDVPAYIENINDASLKQLAININALYLHLGRKVKQDVFDNPDRYSIVPVDNGFIIPGGRFRELYYWDTFWIVEGLLVSGMKETAKGVLENLIQLLNKFGHIPNGSRWYYENRSQPPLLIAMVASYLRKTKDFNFIKANIGTLELEIDFWLQNNTVTFKKGQRTYTMLRYYAATEGPRPESYREDFNNAQYFDTQKRRTEFYIDTKSAAESGWDFSTRWFINTTDGTNNGNLTTLNTKNIIPVDLNAIFANALENLAFFRAVTGHPRKGAQWGYMAKQWRSNIQDVLWNEKAGIWFDYDILNKKPRQYFYTSNIAPLWMKAVDKKMINKIRNKVISYMKTSTALDYPGGVPTSLIKSGEQWDFPNAWPPEVSIVVNSLEALGSQEAKELAFNVAQVYIRSCLKGFTQYEQMFEKYDVNALGQYGGGGEYTVQEGFGWSNGVAMEFLSKYGANMTAEDSI